MVAAPTLSPPRALGTPYQNPWVQLKPRSETVISLNVLNPSISLNSQLLLAKAIVKVLEEKALSTILNVSNEAQYLDLISIFLEPFNQYDATVFAISPNYTQNSSQRIKLLRSTLRLNHLNPEESHSISQLCSDYNDIFFLPNDILTPTN